MRDKQQGQETMGGQQEPVDGPSVFGHALRELCQQMPRVSSSSLYRRA
jgi:hypothetical protein